jgi:hypothetical protein
MRMAKWPRWDVRNSLRNLTLVCVDFTSDDLDDVLPSKKKEWVLGVIIWVWLGRAAGRTNSQAVRSYSIIYLRSISLVLRQLLIIRIGIKVKKTSILAKIFQKIRQGFIIGLKAKVLLNAYLFRLSFHKHWLG